MDLSTLTMAELRELQQRIPQEMKRREENIAVLHRELVPGCIVHLGAELDERLKLHTLQETKCETQLGHTLTPV